QLRGFTSSVSHDLRAPLRHILGFGAALQEDCGEQLGPEGRKHLERVMRSTRQLEAMLEGAITVSRTVQADMERAPIDLSALANEVAGVLQNAAPARSIDLIVQPDLHAVGDRVLLRTLLEHLLGNAIKFTGPRERASIEVGALEPAAG